MAWDKGLREHMRRVLMIGILCVWSLAACDALARPPAVSEPPLPVMPEFSQPSPSPLQVPPSPPPQLSIPTWTPAPSPTVIPTPTPLPAVRVALAPGAPAALGELLATLVDSRPDEFVWGDPATAEVTAGFDPTLALGSWVFAVAAPFPTVADEVALSDLAAAWRGEASGPLAGSPLMVSPETALALEAYFGQAPVGVQLVEAEALLDRAWAELPAWSVVPFEALEPRWKVLRVDGLSPLDKPLDLALYPLALPIGLSGRVDALEKVWIALRPSNGGITNRDEGQMTILAMTGVTALVRATAFEMEIQGIIYPGGAVAEVMLAADIAHVSNEVSFAADCPYPNPARQEGNLQFCSDDRYIELLEAIGVDVVELTGNHNNDWGTLAFSRTLTMYQERDWKVFGGGANNLEASQALTITHNGNVIGFLGCNPVGPASVWATEESPGVASCTIESLAEAIAQLAPQVDVVVVGIQYYEHYAYSATTQQKIDFAALAAAGANIVSGSQGHHAQGFAFPGGNLVHYGLGNLFFDQMDRLGTRQTFVDRHVIYGGKHISTELWTGLIENWARPRPMTADERASLLQAVFSASDW